jgi:hypothetical protein
LPCTPDITIFFVCVNEMEKWKNDGPPALTFDSFKRTARLLSPLKNFELDAQEIEFRKNPLLGYW